jgi:hypothetical protein
MVFVDIDDSIIEVHGHAKQGASFGYTHVRGLNMLLATASTAASAPVVVAQRLRKGSCGSPRGAKRLVADALKTVQTLRPDGSSGPVLLRADSAFYGKPTIGAAVRAGAQVSVTVRMTPNIKAAIATIADDAWTAIQYTDAIVDEDTGQWISRAEVAEVPFTAFASSRKDEQVPGRLVVRRIPDFNAPANPDQASLFELWRFHAFFTTSDPEVLDTVAADKTHRAHAIIEQIHADLKNSALAHMPTSATSADVLPNETAAVTAGLLQRAIAWFEDRGVTVQELLTDNGPALPLALCNEYCAGRRLTHLRTSRNNNRPHGPPPPVDPGNAP